MSFAANVLKILIASPGDTTASRDAAEKAMADWNRERAEDSKTMLLPRRWETDSVPLLGAGDAQEVISKQLVRDADILIGIFYTRLGTPTSRGVSGTAEEIEEVIAAGKPVHVYFSEEPVPHDVDIEQLTALRKFRADLEAENRGLLGTFSSPDDLANQVRRAISSDLSQGQLPLPSVSPQKPTAKISARYNQEREPYIDSRGKQKVKTVRQRIEVTNDPSATGGAHNVQVTLQPPEEGRSVPNLWNEPNEINLPPGASFNFPITTHMGISTWETVVTWLEDSGEPATWHQTMSAT